VNRADGWRDADSTLGRVLGDRRILPAPLNPFGPAENALGRPENGGGRVTHKREGWRLDEEIGTLRVMIAVRRTHLGTS